MAKHRRDRNVSRRFDINNQNRRDDLYIASDLSDGVFEPVSRSLPSNLADDFVGNYNTAVRSTLQDVEDRRNYYPGGRSQRPAHTPRRHLAKTKPTKLTAFATQVFQQFNAPKSVAVCVRRNQRTEVLHAFKKTGKGSRFNKRPKFNQYSRTRC